MCGSGDSGEGLLVVAVVVEIEAVWEERRESRQLERSKRRFDRKKVAFGMEVAPFGVVAEESHRLWGCEVEDCRWTRYRSSVG